MSSIIETVLSNLKKEILREITRERTSGFVRIMKNEASAKNYAKAMFNAASDLGKMEAVKSDFEIIDSTLSKDKDVFSFFKSGFIDGHVKVDILRKVYDGIISEETFNLLSILIERDLIKILPSVTAEYENLCDEYYNVSSTKIITSEEIDDMEALKSSIRSMVNKDVHFTVEVDESIIGGIIVEMEDVVYDYSMRRLLNGVKSSLFAENN